MKKTIPKLHSIKWKNGLLSENISVVHTERWTKTTDEAVLKSAFENGVRDIVLIGFDKNGEEYLASSSRDKHYVHYMLSMAANRFL